MSAEQENQNTYELSRFDYNHIKHLKVVVKGDGPSETRTFHAHFDIDKMFELRESEECTTVEKDSDPTVMHSRARVIVMPGVKTINCTECSIKVFGDGAKNALFVSGNKNLVEGDHAHIVLKGDARQNIFVLEDSQLDDAGKDNAGCLIDENEIRSFNIRMGARISIKVSVNVRGAGGSVTMRNVLGGIGSMTVAPGAIAVQHVGSGQIGMQFHNAHRRPTVRVGGYSVKNYAPGGVAGQTGGVSIIHSNAIGVMHGGSPTINMDMASEDDSTVNFATEGSVASVSGGSHVTVNNNSSRRPRSARNVVGVGVAEHSSSGTVNFIL